MVREVVTLQVGTYSNHVACHFWNIEDQYRLDNNEEDSLLGMDAFFRTCTTNTGKEARYPRTVLVETQQEMGAINLGARHRKLTKNFREEPPPIFSWGGGVKLCQSESYEVNNYQSAYKNQQNFLQNVTNEAELYERREELEKLRQTSNFGAEELDGNVRYWSDYSQIDYHPKSIYSIPFQNHLQEPFQEFSYGTELFHTYEKVEEYLDKVRFFVEECDNLQGFHFLADDTDAFGGMAIQFLSNVRDDFPFKPILFFPITPEIPQIEEETLMNRRFRMNHFLVQCKAWELVDSITTIDINTWNKNRFQLDIDFNQRFHTSALIGGSLQTVTSPYRYRQDGGALKSVIHGLVMRPNLKKNLFTSSFPLPFDQSLPDLFSVSDEDNKNDNRESRANNEKVKVHESLSHADFMANFSHEIKKPKLEDQGDLRVISEWGVLRGSSHHIVSSEDGENGRQIFDDFMARSYPCYRRAGVFVEDPVCLPIPFPFKKQFDGYQQIATCTTLFTDTEQATQMTQDCNAYKFLTTSHETFRIRQDLSAEEIHEMREQLITLRDGYERP